jgi:NTE family protein
LLLARLATQLQPWPPRGSIVPIDEFDRKIAKPFERLCGTNIRTRPILERLLPWNWLRVDTAVRSLAHTYAKHLSSVTLDRLSTGPRFVFCATDMAFGVNWIFDTADPTTAKRRAKVGDYQAGYMDGTGFPVARAVAASSCFPPVFNPLELRLQPEQLKGGKYKGDDRAELVRAISLSDGGVYDNHGLQPLMKRYATILVSNGGAPFGTQGRIGLFAIPTRLQRYAAIAARGGGAQRRSELMSLYTTGQRTGTYWGIATPPSDYSQRSSDCYPDDIAELIASIRTDLDAFSPGEQAVLQNHGYLQMDAAARTFLSGQPLPIATPYPKALPPYPDWLDPDKARHALRTSAKRRWV